VKNKASAFTIKKSGKEIPFTKSDILDTKKTLVETEISGGILVEAEKYLNGEVQNQYRHISKSPNIKNIEL
jgi:hypothetical protein